MLRHCCVCVYGDDLAECFGHYEPSWEIAKHWNQDVGDWLNFYRDKIAKAGSARRAERGAKDHCEKNCCEPVIR